MAYFGQDVIPSEEGFKRYSPNTDAIQLIKSTNSLSTFNNYSFRTKGTSTLRLIIRKSLYDDFETDQNVFGISPFQTYNLGYDGSKRSFRTKKITHSQSIWSYFTVDVSVPSTLKFKWQVASENTRDIFHFSVNGTTIFTSGNSPTWHDYSRDLPVGKHKIGFGFSKDHSVDTGYDGGLVDNLEIVPKGSSSSSYINLSGSKVTIDGVTVRDIEKYINTSASTDAFYVVDITGLNPVVGNKIVISGLNLGYVYAVEVDNSKGGALIHHNDEVFSVTDLMKGKMLRCRYVASSNAVGTFSLLGQEDYRGGYRTDFIDRTVSTPTPNGNFYFIMVDTNEETGQPILMADRVIQHSISYNTLKSAGAMSGRGIVNRSMGERKVYISAPTGFPTIAEVKDSEGNVVKPEQKSQWQKLEDYVKTVDYNHLVDGLEQVWNSNTTFSITQSLYSASNYYARKIGTYTNYVITATTNSSGFRPLLEISAYNKLLIFNDGAYKTCELVDGVPRWRNVTTLQPTVAQFSKDGIYNFQILDRVDAVVHNTLTLRQDLVGSGFSENSKIYAKRIDLETLRNIKKMEVD
ncbi:hypothetical protein ABNX05_18225 [Lysinibacillus sp. M3]|uniref:Uncharacterized protein n=1 Tax=Lysinibacillus zambalensis TaxID=3160866 RepID=A0ABV1MVP0_9BACI